MPGSRSFIINTTFDMMVFWSFFLSLILLQICLARPLYAETIQTQYATIEYDDHRSVQEFNEELYLPRQMSYKLREKKLQTIKDEIGAKIDVVLDKVQNVLQMFIPNTKFAILLFPTARDAQDALFAKYGRRVNFISFYSRRDNILYLSAEDATLRVVAHELGHVVVEHYFNRSPPVKMHEVMAQYAESHITD